MLATLTDIVFLIAFPVALYALVDCGLRWRACWSAVHEAGVPLADLGSAPAMPICAMESSNRPIGDLRRAQVDFREIGERWDAPPARRKAIKPSDLAFAA